MPLEHSETHVMDKENSDNVHGPQPKLRAAKANSGNSEKVRKPKPQPKLRSNSRAPVTMHVPQKQAVVMHELRPNAVRSMQLQQHNKRWARKEIEETESLLDEVEKQSKIESEENIKKFASHAMAQEEEKLRVCKARVLSEIPTKAFWAQSRLAVIQPQHSLPSPIRAELKKSSQEKEKRRQLEKEKKRQLASQLKRELPGKAQQVKTTRRTNTFAGQQLPPALKRELHNVKHLESLHTRRTRRRHQRKKQEEQQQEEQRQHRQMMLYRLRL
eukprot:g59045.t1